MAIFWLRVYCGANMKQQIATIAAVWVLAISSIAVADAPQTSEQIKQLYTDGKYKDVIMQISKALSMKGPDAAQYDKHDLLLLKGEASLRTKSKSAAADAFKQAATAATEPNDIAIASATAELVKQSNGALKYQPKTKASKDDKPQPIDIVEPDSRKLAFAAMQTDMVAVAKPKVDAALKSTSLSEVAQEAKDPNLLAVRSVEIAATGSDTESKQMLSDLGHHAYAMMDAPLDKLLERVKKDIDAVNNRNKPTQAGQPYNNAASSKTAFVTEISNVSDSAKVYDDYARAMQPVFGDATDFNPVLKKVDEIAGIVKDLKRQVGN